MLKPTVPFGPVTVNDISVDAGETEVNVMFSICCAVMFPLIASSTFSPFFVVIDIVVAVEDGFGVGDGV